MKVSPKARPARWIAALALAGALVSAAPVARAEEDEPFPSPASTADLFETFGVMLHGAAMGMTAIW